MTLAVIAADKFLKAAGKLPSGQAEHLAHLLELLRQSPFTPQLHTKVLSGQLAGYYSFRLGRATE